MSCIYLFIYFYCPKTWSPVTPKRRWRCSKLDQLDACYPRDEVDNTIISVIKPAV